MRRIDLRIPRKPGSTVTIDGADYTIGSECFRGGTALCYSASRDGQTEHYVIKEIYPPAGAGRNKDGDVCSTSGNSYEICLRSFRNEIYLMENASSDTFQSWHFVRSDTDRGIGVMRMTPKDTTRLDKAITEYAGENHTPMERLGWALRITKSILIGLHKLHTNARLLHLDLSLTNIFLSQDGNDPNAFFLDFGEARQLNDLNVCPADSGSTSLYGAPERFSRSTRTISSAADTFSTAVLFYHILTAGSWAYQNQPIPEAAMLSKWDCAEAKYGLGCMGLPVGTEKAVFQFLKKGMAYRPDRRYQTAMEMLEQVERLLQIVSQKGIFRELILDRSAELYQKTVFYKIAPELEPQIPTSDRQHILYLGDGGSGKTTHLFTLWKQTLEKAAEDFCSPLPIYVSVSKFEGQDSNFIIDQILKYYIKDWDGGDDVGRKQINKLLSTESYVLFLDGLNESTMPDGLYQQIELLTKYPMLRIYAASRVPFDGKAWDCFEKINISALTKEQVDYVLKLFQRYDTYNDKLLETLRRPMFMAIFLRLEPLRFSKEISTPGEILDAYWEHLIVQFRDANHPNRNAALWKYALNTALPRFSAENKSLHFSDHQVNFRYPAQEIIQVWKNCGVVRMVHYSEIDDREDYVFAHQNYRDFAVAKRLAAEMKEWNSNSKMFLSSGPFEESVLSYLGDILGEYAYAGKTQLPINSPVEKWMQEHLAGKNGPTTQIVVRNLIECMKYNRNNCITAKYDGLDLSLVRFYGCSLPKSSFNKAIVPEFAFVSDGHKQRIDNMAFAPKKGNLFTSEGDTLFCWDVKTGVLRYRHVAKISEAGEGINVSPDEQYVVINGLSSLVVLNVDDGSIVSSYRFPENYQGVSLKNPHLLITSSDTSWFELASFLTDSEKILLASSDGVLWQISAKTGERISPYILLDFPDDCDRHDYFTWNVGKFVLSHKRDKLVVVYYDRPVEMYYSESLSKNSPISAVLKELIPADVAFSTDDKYLIAYPAVWSDYEDELVVYSLMDDECILHGPRCPCYEYSHGVTITGIYNSVVVHPECQEEGPTFVWNFVSNTKKEIINMPDCLEIYSGAYKDSNYLFFADNKLCVTFWDGEVLYEKTHVQVGYKRTQFPEQLAITHCGILGKKMWRLTWAGHIQVLFPDTQEGALCYVPETEIKNLKCNDGHVYWQDGDRLNVVFTNKENNTIRSCITIDGDVIFLSPGTNEVFLYCGQTIKIIPLQGDQKEFSIHGAGRWIEQIEWSKHNSGKLYMNGIEIDPWKLKIAHQDMDTISHMNSDELSVYLAKWCFLPEFNRIVSYRFDVPWCSNPDFDFSAFSRFVQLGLPWRSDCDGSLCVWSIKSSKQILRSQVLIGQITKFIHVPGTSYIIAIGKNERSLWDITKCREIATWRNEPDSHNFWCFHYPEEIWDYFNKHVDFLDGLNPLTNLEMTTILFCQLDGMIVRWSANKQRIAIGESSHDWTGITSIDVFGEREKSNHIFHEHGGIRDFCLDERGNHLIVYGKDSSLYCYDVDDDTLLRSEDKRYSPVEFIWPSIDARNIDQCDFKNARFCGDEEAITNTLRLNGAIVD